MIMRKRIFEDKKYAQPSTPWLWKDNRSSSYRRRLTGWAVLDGGETVHVAGTVSAALVWFEDLTGGKEDGTTD